MIIGIPKETKERECRVALTPETVGYLVSRGNVICVQRGAGKGSGFSDDEYVLYGAIIKDDVYDCDMIVRVKAPSLGAIKKNQIIMAYLHIEKGQNPELLNRLIEQKTTSFAYESIVDLNGKRLVSLGHETGIIGMIEGLRLYGQSKYSRSSLNPFRSLKSMWDYKTKSEAYHALKQIKLNGDINVTILGKGRVSKGAQEVLRQIPIIPAVLYRDETPHMRKYLPKIDILVNAVTWFPGDPHIVKREDSKLMKKKSVIVDISCDKAGAIESCVPTTWMNPTYIDSGILHFCVDNMPSAMARESSIHLSKMILPFVERVAKSKKLQSGCMTCNGKYAYKAKID